jgi:hypothetical protein
MKYNFVSILIDRILEKKIQQWCFIFQTVEIQTTAKHKKTQIPSIFKKRKIIFGDALTIGEGGGGQ